MDKVVKLHPAVEEFLEKHGNVLEIYRDQLDMRERWYYMPFWLRKGDVGGEYFTLVSFEQLPDHVKKFVKDLRD